VGPVAEGDGARLILANCFEHFAEGRVDNAVDERETRKEDHKYDRVHDRPVLQVEYPEKMTARHRLDTILAASEFGLQREEKHHLRERKRDHGEVDALTSDGERSGKEPAERGG